MHDEPLIDEELAAFLQGGVSMHAASCAPGRAPGLARPLGCRVSADRRTVTVFLLASQAAPLLEDFRGNGRIAVVFSRPRSHRTVQLKGRDARVGPTAPEDARIVGQYRQAFVEELSFLNYDPSLPRTLLSGAQDDLVAVSFTPSEAFVQTPGPGAGAALKPS
jgi:hypothetical protein